MTTGTPAALTLALCLILGGCAQPPESVVRNVPDLFNFYGGVGSGTYAGVFDAATKYVVDGTNSSVRGASGARALIYDSNGHPYVLSGQVSLDSVALTEQQLPQLMSWPSQQIWEVVDTGQIGSFSDTISAPNLFRITYPKQLMQHDTVSTSAGFTIAYTSTGTDSVRVIITGNSMLASAFDSTVSTTTTEPLFVSDPLSASGSYTVTPAQLASFSSARVLDIYVATAAQKTSVHNGRQFLLRSTVASQVSTFAKP